MNWHHMLYVMQLHKKQIFITCHAESFPSFSIQKTDWLATILKKKKNYIKIQNHDVSCHLRWCVYDGCTLKFLIGKTVRKLTLSKTPALSKLQHFRWQRIFSVPKLKHDVWTACKYFHNCIQAFLEIIFSDVLKQKFDSQLSNNGFHCSF